MLCNGNFLCGSRSDMNGLVGGLTLYRWDLGILWSPDNLTEGTLSIKSLPKPRSKKRLSRIIYIYTPNDCQR